MTTDEQAAFNARNARDLRYPKTIEQALSDCLDALTSTHIAVVPTNELMIDMLRLLVKLKHS